MRERELEASLRPPEEVTGEPVGSALGMGRDDHPVGREAPECILDRLQWIGVTDRSLREDPYVSQALDALDHSLDGATPRRCVIREPVAEARVECRSYDEHLSRVAAGRVGEDGVAELVASCCLVRDHEDPKSGVWTVVGMHVVLLSSKCVLASMQRANWPTLSLA